MLARMKLNSLFWVSWLDLIIVNCWPSPTGSGTCDVTVEFELQNSVLTLTDVNIIIPYSGQVTQPGTAGTGSCFVNESNGTLNWSIPSITRDGVSSGILEFSMDSEDVGVLYPIQVHFSSNRFVPIDVSFLCSKSRFLESI
jgi:hypothetical protein